MANFNAPIAENLTITDSISRVRNLADLGFVPKQVRALLLSAANDRSGVQISWDALKENASTYEVYRQGAVVQSDIQAEPMPISDGDTLILKVRGEKDQTITLSNMFITDGAATVAEVVANINAVATGLMAFNSENPLISNVYIRATEQDKRSSIEVIGGTANAVLNFPLGIFSANLAKSQSQKIGQTTHPTTNFDDVDGDNTDYYYVQAVSSTGLIGQKSVVKSLQQYVDDVPPRTIVYGYLYDAAGNPARNKVVRISSPDDVRPSLDKGFHTSSFGIVNDSYEVKTDKDGYFEIEAIQDAVVKLQIPSILYEFLVEIPISSINFVELPVVHDDLRTRTTSGVISKPGFKLGSSELVIGEVKVINEDDAIPVRTNEDDALTVIGSVSVTNLPAGMADPATETTLAALLDKFDGAKDLGDVGILNLPLPISDNGGSLTVDGSVDIDNFPAVQDVNIVSPASLPVSILGSSTPLVVNIGDEGGLALESTLAALNAKFSDGNDIGDVTINNGTGGAAVPIRDGGNVITVDGVVDIGNLPDPMNVLISNTPIPIRDGGGSITVDGTVSVSSFPPGAATEATLQGILSKFDGTKDIGNVSILGQPIGVSDAGGSLTVDGSVNIGNFPATQDVNIQNASVSVDDNGGSLTVDGTIDATIVGSTIGALSVDINNEGGLALESTLTALNAKLVDGTDIGDVTINNGVGGAAVPIRDGGNSITVDGSVNVSNTHIPLSLGNQEFYRDNLIEVIAEDPSRNDFVFGFTSISIIISNDEDPTLAGITRIEYSFDAFASDPRVVLAGEVLILDNIRKGSISIRVPVGSDPRSYRLWAWGG